MTSEIEKSELLTRVAKLRWPIAYECGRGCTHKDCEKTRKYNRLITDIEHTIKTQKGKLELLDNLIDSSLDNLKDQEIENPDVIKEFWFRQCQTHIKSFKKVLTNGR